MPRPVNQAGVDLVKHFEGFRADAYLCPAGKWTIGYGHTEGVTEGAHVSLEEAEALLRDDLRDAGEIVSKLITVPLNDNQYAALCSFVFNTGRANLLVSTLRKLLNEGDYAAVPTQLRRWVKARHPLTHQMVTLPGLVRRRDAEIDLWLKPEEPRIDTP